MEVFKYVPRVVEPSKTRFAFDKVPVGINSLNKILPEMCEAAGFKRKTAHSLRVTCVSSLAVQCWNGRKIDSRKVGASF